MLPKLTIVVDEIPQAGLAIAGELPPEWLGESALTLYRPASPVTVALAVRRHQDMVHVEGQVRLVLDFECSRTLAPGTVALALEVQAVFQPAGRHEVSLGDGIEVEAFEEAYDDEGLLTYDGPSIDLEPLIREEVLLAQDPYPVVEPAPEAAEGPLWSSAEEAVDPRWDKLKQVKPKL
jgi:uncharacterized metal-binding protein YceD (DUF177 family)